MTTDFVPPRDSDLLVFSNNFDQKINLLTTAIGLTVPQCTSFTALNDAWADSLATVAGGGNSTPNVILKNQARANLVSGPGGIRELVGIIQKFPGTTNAQRAELNITVPDEEPSPIAKPAFPPLLVVRSVSGRAVSLVLSDPQNPSLKRIPDGVEGAIVMSYIGEEPPASSAVCTMQGPVQKTRTAVVFPESVAPGTKVWLTAMWFNRRGVGPACDPVSTYITHNGALPAVG